MKFTTAVLACALLGGCATTESGKLIRMPGDDIANGDYGMAVLSVVAVPVLLPFFLLGDAFGSAGVTAEDINAAANTAQSVAAQQASAKGQVLPVTYGPTGDACISKVPAYYPDGRPWENRFGFQNTCDKAFWALMEYDVVALAHPRIEPLFLQPGKYEAVLYNGNPRIRRTCTPPKAFRVPAGGDGDRAGDYLCE